MDPWDAIGIHARPNPTRSDPHCFTLICRHSLAGGLRYCSPACQHSDWKTHKAQCVRQWAGTSPASQPAGTQQQPATGATGASGSRRVDPKLHASLLQKLKKKGLVPITPANEVEWYGRIQDGMSRDGKVRRDAWPIQCEPYITNSSPEDGIKLDSSSTHLHSLCLLR